METPTKPKIKKYITILSVVAITALICVTSMAIVEIKSSAINMDEVIQSEVGVYYILQVRLLLEQEKSLVKDVVLYPDKRESYDDAIHELTYIRSFYFNFLNSYGISLQSEITVFTKYDECISRVIELVDSGDTKLAIELLEEADAMADEIETSLQEISDRKMDWVMEQYNIFEKAGNDAILVFVIIVIIAFGFIMLVSVLAIRAAIKLTNANHENQ